MGVLVPARTPATIIALLHREIVTAIGQSDTAESWPPLASRLSRVLPTEFAARIESDISKWAQVIRAANIKAD